MIRHTTSPRTAGLIAGCLAALLLNACGGSSPSPTTPTRVRNR
jgi:hypothetical protein